MRKMRKRKRQMNEEASRCLLEQGKYGVLSTVSDQGQPYGVPLSYVFEDEKIYFHCALKGHKLDNLMHDTRASFCIVNLLDPGEKTVFTQHYESIIAFGAVEKIEAREEKKRILLLLCEKYVPGHERWAAKSAEGGADKTGVFCLTISHHTGKSRNENN